MGRAYARRNLVEETARKIHAEALAHFIYVPEEEKFKGEIEVFDEESDLLKEGKLFTGDCDCYARTATKAAADRGWIKKRSLVEIILRIVNEDGTLGGGHFVGGVIDRAIEDVWLIDNRMLFRTPKMFESVESFNFANTLPQCKQMEFGYIAPYVPRLSQLRDGLTFPSVRTKALMMEGYTERYRFEMFRTLDTKMTDWYTQRDDLPWMDFRDA